MAEKPSSHRKALKDEKKWFVIEFTNETVDVAPDIWILRSLEPTNAGEVEKFSVYWPKKNYQSYKITGFIANRTSPSDFEHNIYKLARVFWDSGNYFFLILLL